MAHDEQSIEQPERDRRHDEEVHCGNALSMVAKERLPSLRGRGPPPRHILGHAGLADVDAAVGVSLDSLKDQIFRLELRRQAGTISEEEYAQERARTEKVLRDLVRG